jgi:hypothetical protein
VAGHPPHPARRDPGQVLSAARGPLPILQRWWFWAALIAALWCFPLYKSLTAPLPPRLPGEDGPPLSATLPDELGGTTDLSLLHNRVLVLTTLPLAEAHARDVTWEELVKLRKHLRGLDKALEYVIFAQGGAAEDLKGWLDEHRAPRPELHFAIDADGAAWRRLAEQAGAPSAEFLLLDRHGRVRGTYGADPADIDRLIEQTGQLSNWIGEDRQPPP